MSIKEQCLELLDRVPDYKMGYLLAYLQGLTADEAEHEAADDAFCLSLLKEYENDPDPEKNQTFSLEDCKREWGLA